MKEKHPIDSFFKERMAERQYPFKEEYWQSASAMIEANQSNKRKKFFWLFLLFGLLGIAGWMGYSAWEKDPGLPMSHEVKAVENTVKEELTKENQKAEPEINGLIASIKPETNSKRSIEYEIDAINLEKKVSVAINNLSIVEQANRKSDTQEEKNTSSLPKELKISSK
ncbi:MAG: hypothetical protein AAF696_13460, partial [Bacteroidota bacterium]